MNTSKFLYTMINCEDSQPKCFSISSAVPAGFFTPAAYVHVSTSILVSILPREYFKVLAF